MCDVLSECGYIPGEETNPGCERIVKRQHSLPKGWLLDD